MVAVVFFWRDLQKKVLRISSRLRTERSFPMTLSFLSRHQTIRRPVIRIAILSMTILLLLMALAACGGSASPTNNGSQYPERDQSL
jgi:hypothetical protein